MVCFTCNLCWHNSVSFFNSMINICIFRCADPETDDYYYFAGQLTRHNSPNCPHNKWLSCLRLIAGCFFFHLRLFIELQANYYASPSPTLNFFFFFFQSINPFPRLSPPFFVWFVNPLTLPPPPTFLFNFCFLFFSFFFHFLFNRLYSSQNVGSF